MFDNLVRFFSLNLNQYEDIGINFPIGAFLSILCVAFCVSLFVIYFRKRAFAQICIALTRHEAFDEKSAKSLKQLHMDNPLIKFEIKNNRRLSSIISTVGQEKFGYEDYLKLGKAERKSYGKIDFENASFYLCKEGKDRAEIVVEKENTSILSPLIISMISIASLFLLAEFLPSILRLIK